MLGFILLVFVLVYAIWGLALYMIVKPEISEKKDAMSTLRVTSVLMLAVAMSFATIAVVYLFDSTMARVFVWLVEVTALLFVMTKFYSPLLSFAAVIIHLVGVLALLPKIE